MINEQLTTVQRFISGKKKHLVFDRIASAVAIHLSVFFACNVLFDTLFSLYPWTYLPVLWMIAGIFTSVSLILKIFLAVILKPSHIQTATIIEKRKELKHPLLSLALEISRQPDDSSESLKTELFSKAASQIAFYKDISLRQTSFKQITPLFFGASLSLLLFFSLPHRISDYWKLPFTMLGRGSEITVIPGSVTVAYNSSVKLTIDGAQGLYPSAWLRLSSIENPNQREHLLRPDSSGNFFFLIDSISESLAYQFSLGATTTPAETLYVSAPPVLRSLQVTVKPPAYTGGTQQIYPLGQGNFSAYAGSDVEINLESSQLGCALLLYGKDTLTMKIDGNSATTNFRVTASSRYTFILTDTLDQTNSSLTEYRISVIPDQPPQAFILSPGTNKNLTPAQVETLLVEGIDDIGISDMRLEYCRNGECPDTTESWVLEVKGQPPVVQKQLIWNLRELSLYTGDTLFYWLRVRDNKPFGRPQIAYSDTFWLRIPTMAEIHRQAADRDQYTEDKLSAVRERQDNLSAMLEQLIKSDDDKEELSYDQKQILEDLQKQFTEQADSLQTALDSLQKSISQLREDHTVDHKLIDKMDLIRKSIEELIEEFGESALFNQQQEQLSLREMKQAVDQLKTMLPQLNEQLDNTLQFLETLRQDMQLSELAARAEKLASQQALLSDVESHERHSELQSALLDQINSLSSDISQQFERDPSKAPSTKSITQLSEAIKESMLGEGSPSQETMSSMSRELLSLSNQLNQMLSNNMASQIEKDYTTLLAMLRDVLDISDWQRTLEQQGAFRPDDPQIALEQQAIGNALARSFTKTDSLTYTPPPIKAKIAEGYRRAQDALRDVVSSLSHGDGTPAMRRSFSLLDQLAFSILELLDMFDESQQQGDQGGSDGAQMMSSMRGLSQQQAAINSAVGELMSALFGEAAQGQELSSQELRDAKEAARKAQESIAEELKRIQGEYGEETIQGAQHRAKELEKEARRLAELLRNPPRDMAPQQDRFLTRLLQSSLSVHQREDQKDERKGTRSQTIYSDRDTPAPGDQINHDTYHLIRRKAMGDNYPQEYRDAVRSYLDSLGEIFLGE